MPALLRIGARLALVAGSLALSLLALEIGLTLAYGVDSLGPYEIVEAWRSPFVFRNRATPLSPEGLRRSAPTPLARPPGRLRILSYGDSIAGGYGVDEPDTYTARVEALLGEARGEPVEVLNMARGHSPSVYAFHLRSDVPRFAPDGVLLQIELLNDVPDEARTRTSGRDRDGLPEAIHAHRYILGWDGHLLAPLAFSGSFVERTKLYAKLSRWYGRVLDAHAPNPLFGDETRAGYYGLGADRHFLDEATLEAGFARLFDVLSGIHTHLARQQIRFLVLIVPPRDAFTSGPRGTADRALLARAAARARALGLPYVLPRADLEARGGAALYMDFCHPTRAGHAAIADALEPILATW